MAGNKLSALSSTPRVEGINLVAYVGKGLDLNTAASYVGSYQAGMGSATHDVYDLPVSALHPFVRDRVPDEIASDAAFTFVRLYVPKSQRGQITDIGIVNGAYAAPAHPYVSLSGGKKMVCAPADADKYKARCEHRPSWDERSHERWNDTSWRPGPGDRFRVTEID